MTQSRLRLRQTLASAWTPRLFVAALLASTTLLVVPTFARAADEKPVATDELVSFLAPKPKSRQISQDVVGAGPMRLVIPFALNGDQLTDAARHQLEHLARALATPAIAKVRIELAGHTDERGDEAHNQDLSQRRVDSAVDYLVSLGVAKNRVEASAHGESSPIRPNAETEPEHALNRRVELRPLDAIRDEDAAAAIAASQHPVVKSTSPPAAPTGRVSAEWGVVVERTDGRASLVSFDGKEVLHSGDQFRLYVHTDAPYYLYVFQVDSNNDGGWLFPRPDSVEANPLDANDHWIPSRTGSFRLAALTDGKPIEEVIQIVVSEVPVDELERHLAAPQPSAVAVASNIKARGQTVVAEPSRRPLSEVLPAVSDDKPTRNSGTTALRRVEGAGPLVLELRFRHE